MALEKDIQNLTEAINKLTETIKFQEAVIDEVALRKADREDRQEASPPPAQEEQPKDVIREAMEQPASPAQTEKQVTADDLKETCLALIRVDGNNKEFIRTQLNQYNAKTVYEVPKDKMAELQNALVAKLL